MDKTLLTFRRATIVDNMSMDQDFLKVRILPDMEGLKESSLPNYACFNPTQIIKGVSEKDVAGDPSKASQVWVICTPDFKIGWVFGEATLEYSIEDTAVNMPYKFTELLTHLQRLRMDTNSFKYPELKVLYTNQPFAETYTAANIIEKGKRKTANCFDIVNIRTGERWMFLQSGTAIALMQDGITLRVGSPDQEPSIIKMDQSSISMTANSIELYGRNKTSLGKHGFKVTGMLGAATAVDGSPMVPCGNITI